MIKKSFANRLILNFTFVVFGGFLAIYFLFNSLMDNHIRAEAEAELNREIMTISEAEIPMVEFREDNGDTTQFFPLAPIRTSQTILSINTVMINHEGMILHPNPFTLSEDEIIQIEALVSFFNDNQSLFEESDDMIMTTHADHTFYMRATPHHIMHSSGLFFFETIPVSILIYTNITPAMNLKNSMNQILLILLGISGTLTLGNSIILQARFKKSIKRLSEHAQVIGLGHFDEKIEGFNYSEFSNLGSSMNKMANMLGTYESNQKQFFQNASHELRTPLMSIQGYTEGLKSGVFEGNDATDIILEESKKMSELVDDILYLSKLNTSQESHLNLSIIWIDALIINASERVKIIAEKANKQIIIGSTANIEIRTDKNKLERAIINILTNAIRYAKSHIQINCSVSTSQLNIVITNDGPLIDEKDLPHIFDRFYKGHSGNTGLGLAITKGIVTGLGGNVCGKNLENGVAFIITLPLL